MTLALLLASALAHPADSEFRPALLRNSGELGRKVAPAECREKLMTTTIDEIYEAALIPERWLNVLDSLATASHSASSAILVFGDRFPPRGVASHAVASAFDDVLRSADWQSSVRVQRMLEMKPAGFVLVDAFVSPEESDGDPVWARLRSQERSCQLCTMVPMPGGETISFTAERDLEDGPYGARDIAVLDDLRPHLARAGIMSARLGLERAKETVATLERIGMAAAVLNDRGRVCATNALFDAPHPAIVPLAFGRVAIAQNHPNQAFRESLERFRVGGASAARSIPVAATYDHASLVIHLLPLCGAARDIFGGSAILMIVSAVAASPVPSAALLNGLFDLSPAEARLLRHLAQGTTIAEVATATGVSVATLRTQLSSIFVKTGTARQAELANLVAGIWTPRPSRTTDSNSETRADKKMETHHSFG